MFQTRTRTNDVFFSPPSCPGTSNTKLLWSLGNKRCCLFGPISTRPNLEQLSPNIFKRVCRLSCYGVLKALSTCFSGGPILSLPLLLQTILTALYRLALPGYPLFSKLVKQHTYSITLPNQNISKQAVCRGPLKDTKL